MAQGKRAGARQKQTMRPVLLVLALGVTAAFVAWGYLALAAIDFGTTAREGDSAGWWFLALASLGAVACLFLALVLVARIARAIGITRAPDATSAPPSTPQAQQTQQDAAADSSPPGGYRRRH